MTLQLNYFAMDEDCRKIAETIFDCFPEGLYRFPPRGTVNSLVFSKIINGKSLAEFSSCGSMCFLVPEGWQEKVIIVNAESGMRCIRLNDNPVIEFCPSGVIEDNIVRIGRIMYSFTESSELKKRVTKLFRVLKRQGGEPYLGKAGLWIFPEARRDAMLLQQWGGKPWNNLMSAAGK